MIKKLMRSCIRADAVMSAEAILEYPALFQSKRGSIGF